ncbi:MAG: phenylacetate--CoA ligase family protein, partial [Candidatus Poribacteria bacterium]|nr:phenylacetate--CoA ligase family protein [Candidatus Poribacteria bacterium]
MNDTLERDPLERLQLHKLRTMLRELLASNPFYGNRLRAAGIGSVEEIASLDDFKRLPLTTKAELSTDQTENAPYGTNLTYSPDRYIRLHQTSGTTGAPLRWLDTEASWTWWGDCWESVFRAAGVSASDRIFFPFSFGPFIGFWSAYEGARRVGALAIPGGAMSSEQRARAILNHRATVIVSTPTYALRLAEVAESEGISLPDSDVRVTIHAGEPGASIPATKERIESAWGATCYDHAGATEVGAWGFECDAHSGMHLNEAEFICEVIDPETGDDANEGELVITNLGRVGMPVLRYRTGDHVRLMEGACPCGRTFRRLEGGVIGRIDDALLIRGVVVFPSAIESVVRRFADVVEYAVDVRRDGAMDDMEVRVELREGADAAITAIGNAVSDSFGLRIKTTVVPNGSLP